MSLTFSHSLVLKIIRYGLPFSVPAFPSDIRDQLSKYGSFFVLYLLSFANQYRIQQGHNHLGVEHIFWALNYTGFCDFLPEAREFTEYHTNMQKQIAAIKLARGELRKNEPSKYYDADNDDDDENDNEDFSTTTSTAPSTRRRSTRQ